MLNRFAICEAYYMFASLYHGGQYSKEYAYFGRLDKLGYKPGLGASSQNPDRLDEDSREIFDRLVERLEASGQLGAEGLEKARIRRLQTKVQTRANAILTAVQENADRVAKQTKNYSISNYLQGIELHYNGYAEPGYTDPECGLIATGNWNEITEYKDGQRSVISDLPARLGRLFEKMGIETEWSDEWASCSDCGKLVRTEPDSYSWKPSYTLGEGELLCHECKTEEPDDESDESDDEPDE